MFNNIFVFFIFPPKASSTWWSLLNLESAAPALTSWLLLIWRCLSLLSTFTGKRAGNDDGGGDDHDEYFKIDCQLYFHRKTKGRDIGQAVNRWGSRWPHFDRDKNLLIEIKIYDDEYDCPVDTQSQYLIEMVTFKLFKTRQSLWLKWPVLLWRELRWSKEGMLRMEMPLMKQVDTNNHSLTCFFFGVNF